MIIIIVIIAGPSSPWTDECCGVDIRLYTSVLSDNDVWEWWNRTKVTYSSQPGFYPHPSLLLAYTLWWSSSWWDNSCHFFALGWLWWQQGCDIFRQLFVSLVFGCNPKIERFLSNHKSSHWYRIIQSKTKQISETKRRKYIWSILGKKCPETFSDKTKT